MIEEPGRVLAVDGEVVWVETVRRTGCGRCDEPGGCGNGALVRSARERIGHLRALNPRHLAVAVGDSVTVGVPADVVLQGALLVYVLPLLLMLAAALGAGVAGLADGGVALAGIGGLLAGFLLVRWRVSRLLRDPAVQPVLLRLGSEPARCPSR